MKIALTEKKNTPPQLFHLDKEDLQIKTAKLVPNFAAR